jgi:hypothetical protein
LENTCPTADPEKEMKKNELVAQCWIWGKCWATQIKEKKCRFRSEIESSVGFSVLSGFISLHHFHEN